LKIMESVNKKTPWYTTAIFMVLAAAFLLTSFQQGLFSFLQPVILSIGSRSIRKSEYQRLIAQKQAVYALYHQEPLSGEQLLSILIDELILSEELNSLDIKVSEKSAANALHENPRFLDQSQNFSNEKLQKFLRQYGITIKQLIEEQRFKMAASYFKSALMAPVFAPKVLKTLIFQGLFQERGGSYQSLTFDQIDTKKIPEPTQEDLKKIYNSESIVLPERRSYGVLRLSLKMLAAQIEVSEKELKEYHARHFVGHDLNKHKEMILQNLRNKKATERLETLLEKIEDALGAGQSLKSIAKSENLPFTTLETDDQGRDHEGKIPAFLSFGSTAEQSEALKAQFMKNVFNLKISQEAELFTLSEGESFFVMTNKILPAETLSFEKAKKILKTKWIDKKKKEKTEELLRKIQVQPNLKSATQLLPPMTINSPVKGVPETVRKGLFSVPIPTQKLKLEGPDRKSVSGLKNSYITSDARQSFLIFVDRISLPIFASFSEQQKKDFESFADEQTQRMIWMSFISSLRQKHPIKLSADAFQ
jgi:hypothetical protein